jgi:hypothetical protein
VGAWWQETPRSPHGVREWIIREFALRGLTPPHCTPEALARALERERHITIEFRPHASDDPGVYGLLYRPEGRADTYVILCRPTQNIVLRRLTLFHELAHLLFHHPLTDVVGLGTLRGYMVADAADAVAEAFAVGAMQYSFQDAEVLTAPADVSAERSASVFGQLLRRTQYWQ